MVEFIIFGFVVIVIRQGQKFLYMTGIGILALNIQFILLIIEKEKQSLPLRICRK